MRIKITQYGYPGDPYADSFTEAGWGGWGNRLSGGSCALTDGAVQSLGLTKARHGAKLQIDFTKEKGGHTLRLIRFWDDRAPEAEPRCDLYQPRGFDKSLPDFAEVTVIEDVGSTKANPL